MQWLRSWQPSEVEEDGTGSLVDSLRQPGPVGQLVENRGEHDTAWIRWGVYYLGRRCALPQPPGEVIALAGEPPVAPGVVAASGTRQWVENRVGDPDGSGRLG